MDSLISFFLIIDERVSVFETLKRLLSVFEDGDTSAVRDETIQNLAFYFQVCRFSLFFLFLPSSSLLPLLILLFFSLSSFPFFCHFYRFFLVVKFVCSYVKSSTNSDAYSMTLKMSHRYCHNSIPTAR
jgi:hypothetical protein